MFARFLSHVSKRTVHTVGAIALVSVIAFFAATRTEVGRNELGRQIERVFSNNFSGQLEIGNLSGNLLNTLYASDIVVKDSLGVPLATIDSIVVRPSWSDLIRKSFNVRSLTIIRPVFSLSFDAAGTSNLETMIRSRGSASDSIATPSSWTFLSAAVQVVDGSIYTVGGDSIRLDDRFDFRNSTLTDISISTRLDWSGDAGLIDILEFAATHAETGLNISGAQTQLVVRDDRWTVNEFLLAVGNSRLSLNGFVDMPSLSVDWARTPFQLNLSVPQISFDEFRLIMPSFPLAANGTLELQVSGPFSDMAHITISCTVK